MKRTSRPPMPRPPKDHVENSQLDFLGPLRHIEHSIEAAYWNLTPHQRKVAGGTLYGAREMIRHAGELLGDK